MKGGESLRLSDRSTDMSRGVINAWAVSSFVALGLLATPAPAHDSGHPPPPPEELPDQSQLPPEVDYGQPIPQAPPPACLAQQCAPCEQRQSPPAVAHQGLLVLGYVGMNVFAGKGILDDTSAGV